MNVLESSFSIESVIDGIQILKNLEKVGRVCYKSEDKITKDSCQMFVKGIISSGHHTILEHEKITVKFICSRSITHALVRHRIASYSQESTHYCNYSKEKFGKQITVIAPPFLDYVRKEEPNHGMHHFIWNSTIRIIEEAYFKLIELGVPAKEARDILPIGLKTELYMTANLREWRHILTLRCADDENTAMKELMRKVLKEFKQLIPIIFDDIDIKKRGAK